MQVNIDNTNVAMELLMTFEGALRQGRKPSVIEYAVLDGLIDDVKFRPKAFIGKDGKEYWDADSLIGFLNDVIKGKIFTHIKKNDIKNRLDDIE